MCSAGILHDSDSAIYTARYQLSEDYQKLTNDGQRILKRYIIKEIEQLLLVLQGNVLKMGDLEARISDSLNRNQIKYLTVKLFKDEVLSKEGKKSGTFYAISKQFSHLRGDSLIHDVIDHLRKKHEPLDSPKD